jgi:hypothetical protein
MDKCGYRDISHHPTSVHGTEYSGYGYPSEDGGVGGGDESARGGDRLVMQKRLMMID